MIDIEGDFEGIKAAKQEVDSIVSKVCSQRTTLSYWDQKHNSKMTGHSQFFSSF